MQAQLPERPDDAEYDKLLIDNVSEPATESTMPGQLLVPVAVSFVLHICLFFLLRQLATDTNPGAENINVQPPGIRISFRPRPAAPPEPESEPEPDAELQTTAQQQLPVAAQVFNEATLPAIIESPETNEAPATDEPATREIANQITEESVVEPPSPSPRLLAPALLDVRDLIQNRAQYDATARIYNNVNCDERQRRTDLIDCGDEDANAQYNFAAAEQNATVEFFSALNPLIENTSAEPADRTGGDARTRASLNNMNGNLGATPLIRSVMGEP